MFYSILRIYDGSEELLTICDKTNNLLIQRNKYKFFKPKHLREALSSKFK